MLKSLKVNNYAIIDNLEINFSSGFNIITGETGAGKSILIGALGLILGNRADTKVLFDLNEKCIVEAHFQIQSYKLEQFFSSNELEYDHDLILRREILPNGKSRAFVNDTPANLKVIRTLCSTLLDMHQQFDTLGLNNPETQLFLLDAYAGNLNQLKKYEEDFHIYTQKKNELRLRLKQREQAEKDQELLQYQLNEFENLSLETGQLKQWEDEQSVLENAESIKNILSKSAFIINEADPSLISNLEEINYDILKISNLHPKIQDLADQFQNVIEELKDVAIAFNDQSEITDLNPEKLAEIQEKLDLAYKIQSKHKLNSEEELMNKWEEISDKINGFKQSSSDITELEEEISVLESKLNEDAEKLSVKRKSFGPKLTKKVETNLELLSMKNAKFEIAIEDLQEFTETGKNHVNYLFSANIGSRLQEIDEVASGGELSRLSLCLKTELAKKMALPTLIFDEIDSGVSGAVSMKMGNMIKKLSEDHQIINITHSPQIASKAEKHYRIFKENNNNRSFTKMEVLSGEEKIIEIAKMLSGDPPSQAAIENAKHLMAH